MTVDKVFIVTPTKSLFSEIQNGCIANAIAEDACHLIENIADTEKMLESGIPAFLVMDWETEEIAVILDFFRNWQNNPQTKRTPVLIVAQKVIPAIIGTLMEFAVGRYLEKEQTKTDADKAVKNILSLIGKDTAPELEFIQTIEDAYRNDDDASLEQAAIQFYKKFPKHPRACIENVKRMIRASNFDVAHQLVSQLVAEFPQDLRIVNLTARVLMHRRSFEEVVDLLKDSEYLNPNDVDRLVLLGESYLSLHNYVDAGKTFAEVLDISPDHVGALKGMATIELNTGDVNKALEILTSSASEDEIAALFNNAGVTAIHSGEVNKAIRLYLAALKPLKKPQYLAKVNYNLGLAHKKLKEYAEARRFFEVAVSLYPELKKAQESLASLGFVDDSGNVHALREANDPNANLDIEDPEEAEKKAFGKIMSIDETK